MTGNKAVDNILLILSLLMTAACVGVFVFTESLYQKVLPNESIERASLLSDSKEKVFPAPYMLDPLIVNLKSRKTRLRFLNLQIYIIPFHNKYDELFESSRASINDSIIDIVSRMEANELNSISGKILLEDRLKKAFNRITKIQSVKGLLFTKFVVQ